MERILIHFPTEEDFNRFKTTCDINKKYDELKRKNSIPCIFVNKDQVHGGNYKEFPYESGLWVCNENFILDPNVTICDSIYGVRDENFIRDLIKKHNCEIRGMSNNAITFKGKRKNIYKIQDEYKDLNLESY